MCMYVYVCIYLYIYIYMYLHISPFLSPSRDTALANTPRGLEREREIPEG